VEDQDVRRFRAQMKLLQRRLRREMPPVRGLSMTALRVLGAVARLPEGSQPRQVADELQMTSSNVAAALRELEEGGFLRREKDSADARRVLLFLTGSGETLVADFRRERDTWLGRAMETLLDEDEQRLLLAAGHLMQRLAGSDQAMPVAIRPVAPFGEP
jgi:DNA-binding MarR family transcriptional regulator